MKCLNCGTKNDDENIYCVDCGSTLSGAERQIEPLRDPLFSEQVPLVGDTRSSVETEVVPTSPVSQTKRGAFRNESISGPTNVSTRRKQRVFLAVVIAGIAIAALGGAYYYYHNLQDRPSAELLPDFYGIFSQSVNGAKIDEIKKFDFGSAITARDEILRNESLPTLDASQKFLVFSDSKDIPLVDLRLIQIDTLSPDGNFKQIDLQAAPIEGNPEMKRLRVPQELANGRYAFVLLDGFFNEGKHKFWPFRVLNSTKSDNGELLKSTSFHVKPEPNSLSKPPQPLVQPPPGGSAAYSATNNLVLRSGPSQTSPKIRNLGRGEQVWVIEYSANTEIFKGVASRFAYVQTSNGQRGWVFAAYLRH